MPDNNLEKLLKNSLPSAPKEEVQSAGERVFESLQSDPDRAPTRTVITFNRARRPHRQWVPAFAIAAAIVIAVLLPTRVLQSAPAVLEDATGKHKIQYGELVRPTGDMSAMLSLTDGPQVETRSMSEFVLERAEDGHTRIHLSEGGMIVDAASQHSGNLYVQTKDITALVSGAVSLVNAEENGSRVAAIGGEIRVQQGTTEKKLGPGEQVASSSTMGRISVKQEVAWSRQAAAHVAMLEQSVTMATSQPPKLSFDVATIRPAATPAPAAAGARGGGGGPTVQGCSPGSSGYTHQLDPRRFAVTRATLFQLIVMAYPISGLPDLGPFGLCDVLSTNADFVSGGPQWLRTDMWDVQAGIPDGVFSGKVSPADPKFQQMLQALLEQRFKLMIRHESRDIPVYLLKVGKAGPKFNGLTEADVLRRQETFVSETRGGTLQPASELPPPANGSFREIPHSFGRGIFGSDVVGINVSMENWARYLFSGPGQLDRIVLDRTNLTGRFDFHYVSDVPYDITDPEALSRGLAASKRAAVKAMGFELQDAKAPYEVWVVLSAEKPSEN